MATGPGLFTVVCNHLKPTMLLRVARPGAFDSLRERELTWLTWVGACVYAGACWGRRGRRHPREGDGLGWSIDRPIDRSMGEAGVRLRMACGACPLSIDRHHATRSTDELTTRSFLQHIHTPRPQAAPWRSGRRRRSWVTPSCALGWSQPLQPLACLLACLLA